MNLKEAYLAMQKNCGIEPGDRVKVLRKANSREMGWSNSWVCKMDAAVGREYQVSRVTGSGVELSDCGANLSFPFFVLEKVGPPPIKIGEHTVQFYDGHIRVGCQTVDNSVVRDIVERLQD